MASRAASRVRRTEPVPVSDWRETLRSRLVVAAVLCGMWTVAIEARLVYLQVFQRAAMEARAADQRERRSSRRRVAETSTIATATCSPIRSTPIRSSPTRPRSRSLTSSLPAFVPRSTSATPPSARRLRARCAARGISPGWRARCRLTRSAASTRSRSKASASSRRAGASIQGASWLAHVLGYVGLDNVGLGGLESSFDPQIRGKQGRADHPARRPAPRADEPQSSVSRPPAWRSS